MRAINQPRSLFVDLGHSRRHLVEWGEPGAPVLLLQHGIRDHARGWDWVADRFAAEYHVIAPDLRGHGDSDWSPDEAYNLFDYVIDLADIVDTLGLHAFDLLGHSLGGQIALRYAATFPEKVRTLANIEGIELPIIRDQQKEPTSHPLRLRQWVEHQRDRRKRRPRYYATLAEAQARMAQQNPGIDSATIDHLTRHGVIAEAGMGFRWKYDNACRFRAPDDAYGIYLDEILDAIACPTWLAYGDASWIPLPGPERLARLKRHRIVIFPGVSHWLHHQARETFLTELASFLAEPETQPSRK
ncbi:MAG: alpha/beta hydrolase [Novosphingobium sp.]|jgi:pimeloyl-ACP methyl ester carboxylesterase|uniref:alpha/beta fold hydrolase n=1 Tax=Sphingobium yanoikuyae TaxID=13690 RepID=UPI0008471377|nr:alpha/beta hydrolase [Sphingobium yanoikuyae]